uniref:Alanine--tRNA ligase n=1 Tax=Gadus morhua TaxID=8049 RepID=A0A8C5CIM4_GADMO
MNVLVRMKGLGGHLRRSYSTKFSSKNVRQTFIDFFEQKHQHLYVPSSPVRPRGDPSLLFVNAGMNQFKPILLGAVDPRSEMARYRRVVNSQKCVRAGGKHNDLDDVGRDIYHHTFFEMMGSWSFGDYFKEEACAMAWSLLTEHYGMSPDRLYVSYFSGDAASGLPADEETRHIWLDIGVQKDRILPFGLQENFWEMGDTGPCGPCSEIHYDHLGGRDASPLVNTGSPEVVELWNLVFMQYNREADGSLRPLPQQSVDTGLGLERLLAVLQDKRSNYDTDLFSPLLDHIHQVSRCGPYGGRVAPGLEGRVDMAYRVVADHVRTLAVCIADGVSPGMSGPELVLRRILRRAVRFSTEVLQAPQGALGSLVPTVVQVLVSLYADLDSINTTSHQELARINQTSHPEPGSSNLPLMAAPVAWSLHRNLGFPLDLLQLILEERGLQVDQVLLDQLLARNHKRGSEPAVASESETHLDVHTLASLKQQGIKHTDQSPKYQYNLHNGRYVFPECTAAVKALFVGQQQVSEVAPGQRCLVLLDRTSFYAEQGGQSHDQGYLSRHDSPDVLYPVEEVAVAGGYVLHLVPAAYALKVGDLLHLHLDQGSLSTTQLQEVQRLVEEAIVADQEVYSREVPLRNARTIPGLRTVDEVYPDPVRVVSVGVPVAELLDGHTEGHHSVELCCGTHLLRTGAIEDLVVVSERQMMKGVSRVVALTGEPAKQARDAGQVLAQAVASLVTRTASFSSSSSSSSSSRRNDAQRLAKEVGLLTDAVDSTPVPQWQRRELQAQLRSLQRTTNTALRKVESQEVSFLVELRTGPPGGAPHWASRWSSPLGLLGYLAVAACDWAAAVCSHLGGSSGGSQLVAKGTGTSGDITEVLRWAEEYAHRSAPPKDS